MFVPTNPTDCRTYPVRRAMFPRFARIGPCPLPCRKNPYRIDPVATVDSVLYSLW